MIGESFFIYIKKEQMMTRSQMKNAPVPVALADAPVALADAPVAPVSLVSPVPAAAPVPVFYPNMFDRWAIPF